jgi:hypothetical protein
MVRDPGAEAAYPSDAQMRYRQMLSHGVLRKLAFRKNPKDAT